MRYITIEDEPLATERIRGFAGRFGFLEEIKAFENAIDAIKFLETATVDLIFLDVHIGDLSGIQFLEIVKPTCPVIVLTAFQEHALKGFELKVTDYLLKPFSFDRFRQAVERAASFSEKPATKQVLFIKTGHKLEKVLLSELLYIEGARDYRRIHSKTKTFKTLETFGALEKELPASRFIRIHKSYLVALDKIDSFEKDMVTIGNQLIPVSETYKKILLSRMQ